MVSMLSVDSVVFVHHNKKEAVAAAHRKFVSEDGDHMTLLKIYQAYKIVEWQFNMALAGVNMALAGVNIALAVLNMALAGV